MIFLNWAILIGMASLVIPVIIHLLSRKKVREIEWGAMMFLVSSLAARRRTLALEEILLLAVRCLLLALAVLAMARPFIPSSSAIPMYIIFPSLLAGTVLAAVAAVIWERKNIRKKLLFILAALFLISAMAAIFERWAQRTRWSSISDNADMAIILDGSSSMCVPFNGKTNFERAREEAKNILKLCRRGDAISLFVAGPAPLPIVPVPLPDISGIEKKLAGPDLRPTYGKMAVLDAIAAAASSLAEGRNSVKRLILITDDQSSGWETSSNARWQFIEEMFKAMPSKPQFICRRLPSPSSIINLSLSDISQSRPIVGTDRPVSFEIRISNSGTQPARPAGVEFVVDGACAQRTDIRKDIYPGAAESLTIVHKFDQPGIHLVSARLLAHDDVPADDQEWRVVTVLDRLPVLIVDGSPSERFFQGASSFIRLALHPKRNASDAATSRTFIDPKVIKATEFHKEERLDQFHAVILANVPRLPEKDATRLTEYARKGGGILIAAGRHAEPAFYNQWRTAAGERTSPAIIIDRAVPPAGISLDTRSLTHPSLRLLSNPKISDAAAAIVRRYWILSFDAGDASVRVGAHFNSGDPFLVERGIGNGTIIMLATALDRYDSNLPSLKCFVPLVHELVYTLASMREVEANIKAGDEIAMDFNRNIPGITINEQALSMCGRLGRPSPEIVTPASNVVQAVVSAKGGRTMVRHIGTQQPGVYLLRLPPDVASYTNSSLRSARVEIPFAARGIGQEGPAVQLSESETAILKSKVDMFVARSADELSTALSGKVPGREIWKYLAAAALLMAVIETALSRHMAIRRKLNTAEPVSLKSPLENLFQFKAALRIKKVCPQEQKVPQA